MLVPPSPKFQEYEVAFVDVFVNVAVEPFILLVKPAVVGGETVI